MICPDEGRLLLYLEGELSPAENQAIMTHLASCSLCLQRLNEVENNLLFSHRTLACIAENNQHAKPQGQIEVWENVKSHGLKQRKEQNRMKLKKTAIAAVIVLAIGILGSVPSVRTATANLLQVFRVQQVDTLTIEPNDMMQIENALRQGDQNLNLESFGSIQCIGENEERSLQPDELTNLAFQVKLPAQMAGTEAAYSLQKMPVIALRPKVENVNRFLATLDSEYKLPKSLDGQLCRISMGDALTVSYPDLQLYQGPSPQIEVPDGVSVEEVARAMVALPIWPENVKRQLEAVNDWEHTLLIPSSEQAQKVQINGKNGVLLNENGHRALIWQDQDILYMLEDQSSDKQQDLVKIAESLR